MTMTITKEKTIRELQTDFTGRYPYLKLEFYRIIPDISMPVKKHLIHTLRLREAGLKQEGAIDLYDGMTVLQLEKQLSKEFGLNAQVSRKSGLLWLETTMTDKWTLSKQNEHGREISLTPNMPGNIPNTWDAL